MKTLLLMTGLACVAYSQDSGLKARELFYTPPPDAQPVKKSIPVRRPGVVQVPVATVANVPLGLRYSVMKRDRADKFVEVDADSMFRSGDRIRLSVDSNTSGYLYVVAQGSSGNWQLLFPSSEIQGGNNRIEKGSSQQIPASNKGQFVFNDQSGTEKLFLVLTRQPEPDLDKLIYSINGTSNKSADRTLMAKATVGNDIVNRLRDDVKSRDLVFEKVDEIGEQSNGQVKTEKATYVVNPSRTDDARLVVDVALKHNE
jgi:Domain of unknown function (DUF4384)